LPEPFFTIEGNGYTNEPSHLILEPQSLHLLMLWVLFLLYSLGTFFLIWRLPFFRLQGLHRNASIAFFALKLVAGFALWCIYTFYYPQRESADIWKYYDDSEVVYNALDEHPGDYFRLMTGIGIDERIQHTYIDEMQHWDQQFENNLFNDSHTIIRFNALMRLISGGNYHTHSLFMCLLAFIGLCALYHWLYKFLWQWKKVVAFFLFVSPSLLFWSSGVLKEGILFFALGMLILHAWRFAEDKKKYRLVWICISVALLAMTKLYMLVFVIPSLLFALHLVKSPRFAFVKFTGLMALLIGLALGIDKVKPELSPFKIIANKQNDFLNLARGGTYLMDSLYVVYLDLPEKQIATLKSRDRYEYSIPPNTELIYWKIADDFRDTLRRITTRHEKYMLLSSTPVAGSLMNVNQLQPNAGSVLKEVPGALQRSIFRPWPWEIKPVMIIPATLENILMFVLIFAMILWYKKPSSKALFWFCVCYVLITLTVTGLTTPVLGALVRYRITAIPFLLFAVLSCIDKEKMVRRIPLLKILE
jgi:hypothetical protein